MRIFFEILSYLCVAGLLASLIWVVTWFYVKVIQKKSVSNRRKKLGLISLATFVIPILIVATLDKIQAGTPSETSASKAESEYKNKDSNYKLYPVTNIKTSYDKDMNGYQVVTGDTKAPDDSTILISTEKSKETNEAKDEHFELVKVKNGHFKAYLGVSYIFWTEKLKKEQKLTIYAIAVEKYDRSYDDSNSYMLGENQLTSLHPMPITLSEEVIDYCNSLIDDNDKESESSSEESKSSSTKNESNPKENKESSSKVESYSTDITYEQLARTPDDYKGKKVSMTGKVVQVMENSDITQLRVAINGNYDDIVLLEINKSDLDKSRILDDDLITFYGTSADVYTYKATLGQEITVPAIVANKIDNQGKAPDDYGFDY